MVAELAELIDGLHGDCSKVILKNNYSRSTIHGPFKMKHGEAEGLQKARKGFTKGVR